MNTKPARAIASHAISQNQQNQNIAHNIDEARTRASIQFFQSQLHSTRSTPFAGVGTTPCNRSGTNPIRHAHSQQHARRLRPTGVNDFDRIFQEIQNQDAELESVGLGHLVSSLSTGDNRPLVCDTRSGLQAYLIRQQLVAGISPNDVVPIDFSSTLNYLNKRCSVPASVNFQPSNPHAGITIPRIPSPEFDGTLEPLPWYPTLMQNIQNSSPEDSSEDLEVTTVLRQEEINEVVEDVLQEIFPDYVPSATNTNSEMVPEGNCDSSDAMSVDSADMFHNFSWN